jgi:hypothetical protein
LLAIIDTWDGDVGDFYHVDVDVDGVSLFKESFNNGGGPIVCCTGGGYDFAQCESVEDFSDSLYNMGHDTARFGALDGAAGMLLSWICLKSTEQTFFGTPIVPHKTCVIPVE